MSSETHDPTAEQPRAKLGSFADVARISQHLKHTLIIRNGKNSVVQSEALEMICNRLACIAVGDPNCEENWILIEGYAGLALKDARARNAKALAQAQGHPQEH